VLFEHNTPLDHAWKDSEFPDDMFNIQFQLCISWIVRFMRSLSNTTKAEDVKFQEDEVIARSSSCPASEEVNCCKRYSSPCCRRPDFKTVGT